MKETIYTIPLNDAFHAQDECPFCFLERQAERHAVEFMLGHSSSYMEDDIRMETDRTGFCRHHYKMMYRYGNHLGSGIMLSTHLKKLNQELKEQMDAFTPEKSSLKDRLKKTKLSKNTPETSFGQWIQNTEDNCYICQHFHSNYERYLDTFFYMYKADSDFRTLFEQSKGFCLPHLKDLVEAAEKKLTQKEKQEFFPVLFHLMEENMNRLQEEVTWFCDKHDYLNKDKDWKNSKDSVQRAMQKLGGGYPADEDFKMNY